MTNPIDSCVDRKMSVNDMFDIVVPKDMGKKGRLMNLRSEQKRMISD